MHLQELIVETRAYLAEMNIPESLADEMFSIRPEDGVVLSTGALTHYRLNTNDIVYQEKADLRRAEQLGISRFELIRRRQAYEHALELGACEVGDCANAAENPAWHVAGSSVAFSAGSLSHRAHLRRVDQLFCRHYDDAGA